MPITRSIRITASVGARGINLGPDVLDVQRQLNAMLQPPRVPLKEDGKNGPKTEAMIRDFQRAVMGVKQPDGRVDVGGKTLARLNDPASEALWAGQSIGEPAAAPTAGPAAKSGPRLPDKLTTDEKDRYARLWAAAEASPGLKAFVAARDFLFVWLQDMVDGDFQQVKAFLNAQSLVSDLVVPGSEPLVRLARGVLALNRLVDSPRTVSDIVYQLLKTRGRVGLFQFFGALEKSPKLAGDLKALGRRALVVSVIVTSIEAATLIHRGQYGAAAGELYKLGMGVAVPWAGLVDAAQSTVEALFPDSQGNQRVKRLFKLLEHVNPLAAGAVYMDTYVTVIEGILKLDLSTHRFEELVGRMEDSPMRVYTEMGTHLGDWVGDRTGRWIYENILLRW